MRKPVPDENFPWSFPILVAQLPEAGLHQVLETSGTQRDMMAASAGVLAITHATASLDVTPEAEGRVHVKGRVRAHVVQACVVTLDPVESDVDEAVEAEFAPPSQIPATAKSVQKDECEDAEIPDLPEPIVNGAIDLGRLATEFLILGIDPYPRKPGVVFEAPEVPEDPEDHPFAALKALKEIVPAPKGKKPKG
jgi:uncharacterized metal-binding protein YceD (DUF177 family)